MPSVGRFMLWALAPLFMAAAPGAGRLTGADAKQTGADRAPSLRLLVDLSQSRLKMYEADTLVWQYPISPGVPEYPTPPGEYKIRKLIWNPRWTPPPDAKWARKERPRAPGDPANPMKVVKIFFREPDYYIHGTGYTSRLGAPASHGCLRMDPEHVAEVARFLMEHGGEPRPESWFWRILHFRSEEKPIYLRNPIPLTVIP